MKGILRQASEIYVLKEEFKTISQKENKTESTEKEANKLVEKTAVANEKKIAASTL